MACTICGFSQRDVCFDDYELLARAAQAVVDRPNKTRMAQLARVLRAHARAAREVERHRVEEGD